MAAENEFDSRNSVTPSVDATDTKEKKKISLYIILKFAFIALGAIMIMWSLLSMSLYFFGNVRTADLDIQRHGDMTKPEQSGKLYRYTVNYTFEASDGSFYSGRATRYAYPTGAVVDNDVYYFSFMPSVNMLSDTASFGPLQISLILVGGAIIFICLRKKKIKRQTGEVFLLSDTVVLPQDEE